MEQLINEINQLLRTDAQSFSQTRILIDEIKGRLGRLENEICMLNTRYTSLRLTHNNTLTNHRNRLETILNNTQNVREKISHIQGNKNIIQQEINNEKCCCDECIRKIINTIYDEVGAVVQQIIPLIENSQKTSINSADHDRDLLIQYQCINQHLNIIINEINGQPNLPDQIDLNQLRDELTIRINDFNYDFRRQILQAINLAKTRLKSQNMHEIGHLSRLKTISIENLTRIGQRIFNISTFLSNTREQIFNLRIRIESSLENLIRILRLSFQHPNNFQIIFLLIIGVFLFFVFDNFFVKM